MKASAKELKRQARETLTGRYTLPMGAFAISQVIAVCANMPFELSLQSNPTVFQITISGLAYLFISLVLVVLNGGQLWIHLNMERGREASVMDVFRFFNCRPDRFLLSGLIRIGIMLPVMLPAAAVTFLAKRAAVAPMYALAALAWIITLIPLALISLMYSQTTYLLVEWQNESLPAIFRKSRMLMAGNKWRRFWLALSFIGMLLLSALSLGIGLLWVIPYKNQAYTEFYLDVCGEK